MAKTSAALAAAIKNTPTIPSDKLDKLRDGVRQLRDLKLEIEALETQAKEKGAKVAELVNKTIPDLFDEVGVRSITLQVEGNVPAYEAKMVPYYKANIREDWPPEQRQAAFDWLEEHGHGDLIKTVLTVELGRGDRTKAIQAQKALDKLQIDYKSDLGVPWSTLTAFVKESIEKHQKTPPLELLGATVGRVVKIKQQ